ncbi:hypothetical protein [Raoultella ornithinolytica]|uniref:hypothetical protein n=1 Tax=Raoultella ornithinolytica TaxID=54291 RepID=UPI0015DBD078|nr:hypothetical protein [Raoultella ornithinolytica]BBQ89446.1 hypothetical protein WP3W18E06_25740 [Raoultella ornithinolytica]
MPRQYEIETACRAAIVIEPSGRRTITTRRFLQELEKVNWHWSPRQANQWIEGDALDDVEVIGVVTHTIIDVQRDDSPV